MGTDWGAGVTWGVGGVVAIETWGVGSSEGVGIAATSDGDGVERSVFSGVAGSFCVVRP